jgi:proline iminopeptidase
MDMSEAENLFGERHVERYQETDGEVGHRWKRGSKILLLTTKGRKTGKASTTPLIYAEDGDRYVIVASKGGAQAHTAEGEERARLWELMNEQWPDYNAYQAKTDREIPVIVLERA